VQFQESEHKQWQWQQQHEQMDKKICTFLPESSLWLHTTWEYIVLLLVCGVLCAAYYQWDRAAILFLVTSWVSMKPCNDFTKTTWKVFRVLELYGHHCNNKGLLPSITVPFSLPLLFPPQIEENGLTNGLTK
jgi:hypothetical protein